MNWLGRFASTMAMVMVIIFVGGVTSVLLFENLTDKEDRENFACLIGYEEFSGPDCFTAKVAKLKAQLEKDLAAAKALAAAEIEKMRQSLQDDRLTLEKEKRRLQQEIRDAEDALLDTEPVLKQVKAPAGVDGYVLTISTFRTVGGKKELVASLCAHARDVSGPDPRTPLGFISSSKVVRHSTVSAAQLKAAGMDAVSFDAAKRLCPWPTAR